MTPLIHPRRVAQMPFIWGNIVATPPGHYNSNSGYSLYIKNIEGRVCQGVVSIAEKQRSPLLLNPTIGSRPQAGSISGKNRGRPLDWQSTAPRAKIFVSKGESAPHFSVGSTLAPLPGSSKNWIYHGLKDF